MGVDLRRRMHVSMTQREECAQASHRESGKLKWESDILVRSDGEPNIMLFVFFEKGGDTVRAAN